MPGYYTGSHGFLISPEESTVSHTEDPFPLPRHRIRSLLLGGGYSLRRRLVRNWLPRRLWMKLNLGRATMKIVDRYGLEVRSGPFAGMRYPEEALGRASVLGAKLLGTYEQELAPTIEALIRERFQTILNVGAGEGYYAVGFALRSPESLIRGYEIDGWQRRLCGRVASANGVAGRVVIEEACRLERLADDALGRVLILCDCEGCELELLQPDRHPLLRTATLLIELHDSVDPTMTSQILSRFARTHDAEIIFVEQRDSARYEELAGLTEGEAHSVLWERAAGSWGLLRPRVDVLEERGPKVHPRGGSPA